MQLSPFAVFLFLGITGIRNLAEGAEPRALVLPVEGRSKLQLDEAGLEFLRGIKSPVAPVVVIGPYRSGKSFLLDQLLNVSCNEGFGVGHTRNTQTKGVWVWSEPTTVSTSQGWGLSLLYIDTEGFESTGKSDSYDDRIFALSALMSSVLIYNLPETVRESDIEKLSFAVELSSGLYNSEGGRMDRMPVEPGNMLWLIQRDFLEGKTVDQMVKDALAPVENAYGDKDISQVNRIRNSLSVIAKNSTAFGLKQPHLERTKLCDIGDEQLDPTYVEQRDSLRGLVQRLAVPKIVMGRVMTGPDLADLVQKVVQALNTREIPSVGSILDSFNMELAYSALEKYDRVVESLRLPTEEVAVTTLHLGTKKDCLDYYDQHRFGSTDEMVEGANELRGRLVGMIEKEYQALVMNNTIESNEVCEKQEFECEEKLERLQSMNLPSKNRFEGEYQECLNLFQTRCVGPAMTKQKLRLEVAFNREHKRFVNEYNNRLYMGLIIISLVDVVLFRFLFKVQLMEGLGWIFFLFLETYPKTIGSSETMYQSSWWSAMVSVWEFLAYNPVTKSWVWIVLLGGGLLATWQLLKKRRRKRSKIVGRDDAERDLDV
ncbi:hypothetical protein BSKO_01748 [Bryopsis sp. KO-2023]|nr:hypothetical protein BSKO_01748 [Bryopsis sp. KO-2023]